jgi:hypothetical protein
MCWSKPRFSQLLDEISRPDRFRLLVQQKIKRIYQDNRRVTMLV